MKISFIKTQLSLAVACALVLGFASSAARAQSGLSSADEREIWTEATKTQVWKSGYGLCWHSAYGPPPSYNECNPAPVAQYIAPPPAPVPAPVYVAPPPPAPVVAPAAPATLPPRKPRG